ncbi:unnamed protein product [Fraxinus pennsylvanica]|uniref:Uncharacterized protein n=1 Tax=Fraxinus pennsylvanica TaxID=56036 RepID=A0AAD1YVX0_9LAMI|nr:unnamed protein product [Fraxinus pennsylvanica]
MPRVWRRRAILNTGYIHLILFRGFWIQSLEITLQKCFVIMEVNCQDAFAMIFAVSKVVIEQFGDLCTLIPSEHRCLYLLLFQDAWKRLSVTLRRDSKTIPCYSSTDILVEDYQHDVKRIDYHKLYLTFLALATRINGEVDIAMRLLGIAVVVLPTQQQSLRVPLPHGIDGSTEICHRVLRETAALKGDVAAPKSWLQKVLPHRYRAPSSSFPLF